MVTRTLSYGRNGILFAFVVALTLVISSSLNAQEKGFGIGAIFGEPTGISVKYHLDSPHAIDGAVAWSFRGNGFFHIHADYLWHFPDFIRSKENFPLYAGVGGRLTFTTPTLFGVRIPVGIAWWVREVPLEVFAEVVPILDLAPETDFEFNGGLGIRYYFE